MPQEAEPVVHTAILKCPACGALYQSSNAESPHEHDFRCPKCRAELPALEPTRPLVAPVVPRIPRAPREAMFRRPGLAETKPQGEPK